MGGGPDEETVAGGMLSIPELWPEESLEAIHVASLRLLGRAGVRVDSQEARELLLVAGCTQGPEDRLLMPESLVEAALAACPARYTLAARHPGGALPVGARLLFGRTDIL